MCKLQYACLSEITTLECPRAYLMESTESQGKPKKKKDKGKKAAPNITYVHRWLRIKFSRFAAWLLRSLAISQSVIQFYFCTRLLFMIQITTPFYLGKALVSR